MDTRTRRTKTAGTTLASTVGIAVGIAAGWIAYSKLAIEHSAHLPEAVSAERVEFEGAQSGRLSYYVDRSASGRPLVLLHSINAAASAYEMRPLFEHYRSVRPVYALDLPGYGFSDRSQRQYNPDLYAKAILEFLSQEVGSPADVVTLSLSSEFAARAALSRPELFNSLAFLSPTGLGAATNRRGSARTHRLFTFPLWSRAFYDLIATRASIQYFLAQSFVGPVPPSLIDYAYATSHQPGAENVPLYFISGLLFTPSAHRALYQPLARPTLAIYDQDAFTSFEMLPEVLRENPAWLATRIIPTRGMAHWDQLAQTVETLDRFWQTPV